MVATVLLGLGIAMGFIALGSMTKTELRLREKEKMNLLAVQKLDEIMAVGDVANQQTDGDFTDFGEPNYKWTMDTQASGTDNVSTVRVIVTTSDDKSTDPTSSASSLIFTSPNTQSGGAQG
jgi:hypothetical protein